MNIFWSRIFIILAAPFVLPYSYLSVLCSEIRRAFRYAWLEVRIECEWIRDSWHNGTQRRT